jgi:hypothetical protein
LHVAYEGSRSKYNAWISNQIIKPGIDSTSHRRRNQALLHQVRTRTAQAQTNFRSSKTVKISDSPIFISLNRWKERAYKILWTLKPHDVSLQWFLQFLARSSTSCHYVAILPPAAQTQFELCKAQLLLKMAYKRKAYSVEGYSV